MDITHLHNFDAPLTVVAALFANEGFAQARAEGTGAVSADPIVAGDLDSGFSVSVRQSVPASSIPAEFRSFIGSDLDVRYTEAWEPQKDEARDGTFAVEILGAPGHAAGKLRIEADGEITRFAAVGAVKAGVPLIGAMIEKAVGSAVLKAMQHQLAIADEWLARA